jgi:Holliday junction resolvase RusA-like endonuclease
MQLDVPPTLNGRFVGKYVLAPKHRAYKSYLAAQCITQKIQPFLGPVSVEIRWHRGGKHRGDIDGRWKPLLDGLQSKQEENRGYGCFVNDNQIMDLHIKIVGDVKGEHERIVVVIKPFDL